MIKFVMVQDGCPCCCSEQPVLIQDLDGMSTNIGVGDPSEVIPDVVSRAVYEAPWDSLKELFEAFAKEPVSWQSERSAWDHCKRTGEMAQVKTNKFVL